MLDIQLHGQTEKSGSVYRQEYAKEVSFYEVGRLYPRLETGSYNVIIIHYSYRAICKCKLSLFQKHALMYLTSIKSITNLPAPFSPHPQLFTRMIKYTKVNNRKVLQSTILFRPFSLFYFLIITGNNFMIQRSV